MFDGFTGELVGALGPTALLALAVLLVLNGRLIPRGTHDAIVADLRETVATERQRNEVLLRQNGELLEHARTTTALIKALPSPEREAA